MQLKNWLFFGLLLMLFPALCLAAPINYGSRYHVASGRIFMGGSGVGFHLCKKKYPSLFRTVQIYDMESGKLIDTMQFEKTVVGICVHPSGRLAVMLKERDLHDDDVYQLKIFGPDLKLIQELPSVMGGNDRLFFDWNAAGDKIAYLDVYWLEDRGRYESAGAWILDLATGEKEKIYEYGESIRWAKHDGNIYIKRSDDYTEEGGVYKYDVKTKTLAEMKLIGVEFSDDGKYYIGSTPAVEMSINNLIYKTTDNTMVDDTAVDVEFVYTLGDYNLFLGGSHKVLTWRLAPMSVFDPDTSKYVRKEIPGELYGWSDDKTKLIVSDGVCQVHVEDAMTGEILKSFTITP
jgi:hypothetical protein